MKWLRRWWPRCEHQDLRCIHGDEINARSGARALCLDCGGALPNHDMPAICWYTGQPHDKTGATP